MVRPVRRRSAGRLALGVVAALTVALAETAGASEAPSLPADAERVRVLIDEPVLDGVVRSELHQARIQGHAIADGESPQVYDVILALDVSGSTSEPSGADVDGDGEVGINPRTLLVEPGTYPPGLRNTDPGDSVLAAEVVAARALLANLDPARVRVGIVSFSGEMNPRTGRRARVDQRDAWLEVPLTSDFPAVGRGLAQIQARGPYGGTNFAAGLQLSITELMALTGSRSAPRPDARKVVLFLTDGIPTFPIGSGAESDPGDVEVALRAARLAHKAGIRVNTYALGSKALTEPLAATELARLTSGTFLPVRNPADIISFLQAVSFANVEDVVVSNLTTGEFSTDVRLDPDGRFDGFVPVREGANRVRVTALASDGSSASAEFDLQFELAGLSGRELDLELDRIRRHNKALELLLERDRIERFREHQQKQLELEVVE